MEVEYFRYVMHLTSVVKGQLCRNWCTQDLNQPSSWNRVRAPKIRAMRRASMSLEQENVVFIWELLVIQDRRYGLHIAIRTMTLKIKKPVQAGAGVVDDSVLKMNLRND